QYLALSDAWGGCQQPIIKENSSIANWVLPRTIEDAITIVKDLAYQYLWVGSVCIDQRDPVDKRTQIGQMDGIYLGAYATIIAS
ncbi:heterokaryon incompatibility, partial [Clohesyomyces aquaticus]